MFYRNMHKQMFQKCSWNKFKTHLIDDMPLKVCVWTLDKCRRAYVWYRLRQTFSDDYRVLGIKTMRRDTLRLQSCFYFGTIMRLSISQNVPLDIWGSNASQLTLSTTCLASRRHPQRMLVIPLRESYFFFLRGPWELLCTKFAERRV